MGFRSLTAQLAALAAALFSTVALAATESHPMRFEHITLDDGLSQSNVITVLQDSQGMMWFGTENGLNRYDGYEFEYFTRERGNPDALSSDFIFDLAEDSAGTLWIGTNGGGLASYDRETDRFTNYRNDPANPNSIAGNVVRSVFVDAEGVVWVGLRDGGVDRFDAVRGVFEHVDLGMESAPSVYSVYQDADGTIWVGGEHGLTRLDPNGESVRNFLHDPEDAASVSAGSVRTILMDRHGDLWVGTHGGGLNRLAAGASTFERFVASPDNPGALSDDRVSVIFEDSQGRLWVGTVDGLNLVDREAGTFVSYRRDSQDGSSLGDNDITSIYEDRSGLLWIGTKAQGLNKWNPRTWAYGLESANELTTNVERKPNVTSFVEGDDGRLWIGTFGDGLNAVDRASGDIVRYRTDAEDALRINDDRVMSLMKDSIGRIWVGTMRHGITRIDPANGEIDTFSHDVQDPRSLSANGVMAMFEDAAGYVWVGTFGGGISRFDPATETFERFAADESDAASLSSDRVTSFAQDQRGLIWIGTESGGLNVYDPASGTFHAFRHDPDDVTTLSADTVYSIHVDAAGVVWVGTHGGGLDRVLGDPTRPASVRFDNVSRTDGLANDVIYGVHSDAAGWLWMSTNYGISRFNPATGEVRNLHRRDGLQSEEFNFGAHYQSESGEMFFGGHNGYNAFRPDRISASSIVPLIALTGFFNSNDPNREGIPYDEDGSIEISWRDDNVAFEFAALDFAAPEQNHYMYKLEGFDRDWIDLGNRRVVTYTDLDDGNYLLRVRAANAEGVWNDAGLSIPVRVTPAPWDTWWAYLGYVALFVQLVAFLWLGHRRRIEREEAYSQRLEREVRDRTESLLEKNQQLRVLNAALQESSLCDPLTGLRNRRFVFEEVSRDLDVIQRRLGEEFEGLDRSDVAELTFMMIDMDNFKPINDTYGHAAGDQLLLEFRDLLLGLVRQDEHVIRWGGDEFVVIAKQRRPHEIEELAERIRSTVANHGFRLEEGQVVHTTCTIGFAAYPLFRRQSDESNLDQIINLADSLMYEAKKTRNAWAGMLSPTKAATSYDFDHDAIESSSMLFRARRAGNLTRYVPADEQTSTVRRLEIAG